MQLSARGVGTTMLLRSSLLCFGLCLTSCVTTPETPLCPPPEEREPAISRECLEQEEGRSYIRRAGSGVADGLMGWRSHSGTATVSIGFDEDSTVASVCLRDMSGDAVRRRARRAAAEAWRLPAAPACFAQRRVDFAWESPIVTDEDIRVAKAGCKGEAAPPHRAISFCRWRQDCTQQALERLKGEGNRLLSECVLRVLPIALRVPDAGETIFFLPSAGASPDAQKALNALAACEDPEDRASALECMQLRGWQPVD